MHSRQIVSNRRSSALLERNEHGPCNACRACAERYRSSRVETISDPSGCDHGIERAALTKTNAWGGRDPPLAKGIADLAPMLARALRLDGDPRSASRTRNVHVSHAARSQPGNRVRRDPAARFLDDHRARQVLHDLLDVGQHALERAIAFVLDQFHRRIEVDAQRVRTHGVDHGFDRLDRHAHGLNATDIAEYQRGGRHVADLKGGTRVCVLDHGTLAAQTEAQTELLCQLGESTVDLLRPHGSTRHGRNDQRRAQALTEHVTPELDVVEVQLRQRIVKQFNTFEQRGSPKGNVGLSDQIEVISLAAENIAHVPANKGTSAQEIKDFLRRRERYVALTARGPVHTLAAHPMSQVKTARASRRSRELPQPTTGEAFLSFLKRHKRRFESHLKRQLTEAQKHYPRIGAPSLATTQALVDLCARGGKRMRPGLLLAGAASVREAEDLGVLFDAAAALELLHAYFLVHDDWMDGDLLRRSGPSVHAALRMRFKDEHLGDATAILAGDWGVAVATAWMARLPVAGARLKDALNCFAEMQLAAVAGQIRDLVAQDDDIEMTYRLKTASYTVEGPLLLGAILVGATSAQRRILQEYAIPVGVAFQLRDDLIGVFAPPEQTGKPFASDVRAGKRTVLVRECLQRASSKDRRFLQSVLGDPSASTRDLKRFVSLLDSTGARAAVESRIQVLHAQGLAALNSPRLRDEGKALLESAAAALNVRGA